MSIYRSIAKLKIVFSVLIFSLNSQAIFAQGEALFKANCSSCHHPIDNKTGPGLQGWKSREPSADWIYGWVANPGKLIASDPYAKKLAAQYAPSVMTAFPNLTKAEIDAIMAYVDAWTPPVAAVTAGGKKESPNYLLYGILTLILGAAAFLLLQVNSGLKKLTDDKEGLFTPEPVPFYRNKAYILLAALGCLGLVGWSTMTYLIGTGRNKDYQPVQPIYYSHKVHAGTNQISCLYCHASAQDGKHSNIPSVNTCMNCHMSIKEYKGEDMFHEDGKQVNGTAEIQKLYDYAGWNPTTKKYNADNNGDGIPDGAKPIPWVKIHNLPDHVYFNHSQHVTVGKQNCQTCHGEIQNMGEVKQFSDLSMGWCINCHRETKVDFNYAGSTGNKYYSIYEKYHESLKDSIEKRNSKNQIISDRETGKPIMVKNPNKMDSITVEKIGGTECQKCHY